SKLRNMYVWNKNTERYQDTRIIFQDFEPSNWTFDHVANEYFWHRFYSHQPDLNYDDPAVHEAMFRVMEFWLKLGVDAFRLDAIPYLYEREGTTCENLPETHTFLKKLRARLDAEFPGRMLLAEANQWPEDSRPYFGDGDECHMAFNFPVMPRMYMALAQEDRFPIIDIMAQTPSIPDNCQWAMFLRNHDELTLEMVTDEDRDYMWRMYATDKEARINTGIRRRLAPLLQNHRPRIHLLNGLLFSLPGTPIIYYGDEIGMGDNIYLGDRNGVRTPMQWSADRNAGFSRANPQRLFLPVIIDPHYHYEQVNVEVQQSNPSSLLWWMKRLIANRKRFRAFGRGSMEFLYPDNRKILAFVRHYDDEEILVVANLSRLVQCFEIDLSAYRGMVPVELSGGTRFPEIGDRPYFLNLGPFAFYWFTLERQRSEATLAEDVPLIQARTWSELFADRQRNQLSEAVLRYLRSRRWFGAKDRTVRSFEVHDSIPLMRDTCLVLIDIEYTEGEPERYLLPLGMTAPQRPDDSDRSQVLIARLRDGCLLYESIVDDAFAQALLDVIARRRHLKGDQGTAIGTPLRAFRELRGTGEIGAQVLRAEQSNTALVYGGDRLFLKLFRRVESGMNADLEITRFLTEETPFRSVPRIAGSLEYRSNGEPATLAVLQGFTANHGDAWRFTLDAISQFFERVVSDPGAAEAIAAGTPAEPVLTLVQGSPSDVAMEYLARYLADAELLGRRTAQMHLALASRDDIAAFAPEPFTPHYQRSIYQHMRTQAVHAMAAVRRRAKGIPEAELLLEYEPEIQRRLHRVLEGRIGGARIRIHGDYHLGQVLYTGNDFVIIDFEGEPARPLSERRLKRSALRDVAGMLRSFHYAPFAVVFGQSPGSVIRSEDIAVLEAAGRFWHRWVGAAFLRAYLYESRGAAHLPSSNDELAVLLDAYLLEKAMYEIIYELNNRPDWLRIPVHGIVDLLAE
ncbi:MAG TPA: maltose alpha-D-glucosyltransferase, partial [Thermoanaerobaculia bacterium]|nr:maltose alpha-D-glucosyltransferase [Thermoanaerobaculia bacterium]